MFKPLFRRCCTHGGNGAGLAAPCCVRCACICRVDVSWGRRHSGWFARLGRDEDAGKLRAVLCAACTQLTDVGAECHGDAGARLDYVKAGLGTAGAWLGGISGSGRGGASARLRIKDVELVHWAC